MIIINFNRPPYFLSFSLRFLCIHLQDNQVLEVRQYSATCWPNPDSPIRNCFDLVNRVGERSRLSDAPTIVHDP